ncbi:peptidase C54, partial [Flammula alnicola]
PPGFYADFTSRIWLTCRSNFPIPIRDKTRSSDSRWGSTIRTSQSLLANALLIVHLGRDWRCPPHQVQTADYAKYVEIITWFLDTLAPAAPFSVHRMTSTVKHLGWGVGQWLGYSAAFHAIK